MFAALIAIGGLSRYRNVELIYSEQVGELLLLSYWMTYIWHHCLVPLRRPFPPTLMDTRKFKSISINETESSNGERGRGGVFSGRRVGIYVFITRTRLQRFTRQELRIEMRGVQCDYQREWTASWRLCGVKKKKKLRWICFSLVVILPLIYLLSKARLWSRGLMTPAAPYLITGWRFDACGGKTEDDGRVLLWNADQSNASCKFGPNITDLLHFSWHLSLDWFPIW